MFRPTETARSTSAIVSTWATVDTCRPPPIAHTRRKSPSRTDGPRRRLTVRVGELATERRAYDQEIDELVRVRRELARIETDRVLEKAQGALTKAQEEAKAIEGLRQQDEAAAQSVALAQAHLDNVSDRWKRRKALIEAVAHRERAVKLAQAELAQLETETQDVAGRLTPTADAICARGRPRSCRCRRISRMVMTPVLFMKPQPPRFDQWIDEAEPGEDRRVQKLNAARVRRCLRLCWKSCR